MRRLALLISAVPLLLSLGATAAFTNNDVSVRQRQSSARRLVSYSDYLSGLHSSPEETPTGKSTEHLSKPSSNADLPSTEKLSTSAAPTDYLSYMSSRATTSSTSGSWAANGYASHQQKETAPEPVKPPVATTDFSYLSEWNTEGKAGSDLDRLKSTPASHSGAGMPSYINALSSTAASYPTSGPGVASYTNTQGEAISYSSPPLVPTPPKSEPSSATDLQSQFGQILENQMEITKQVGMSIAELKEIQDQQGQYIQLMAKNDIEMTQMMVSVRDDSSEMKSDMRRSQTQQAGLEDRLAALETKLVDQATQVRAPPEPTAFTPTAAVIPQTSILDTSSSVSNTINAGRAVVQDISPPATKKSEASAQVASGVERVPSVPMVLAKRHKLHLALMISCGVYGAIIQTLLHTDLGFRRSKTFESHGSKI
jgi:hypothetical protein